MHKKIATLTDSQESLRTQVRVLTDECDTLRTLDIQKQEEITELKERNAYLVERVKTCMTDLRLNRDAFAGVSRTIVLSPQHNPDRLCTHRTRLP